MSDLHTHKTAQKLSALNYKLTPATLANKITSGGWIPAKHLLYLSAEISTRVVKGNARIIATMPPRHGKPRHVEEPVLMKDGSYKLLGDIEVEDEVITHTGEPQKVLQVFEQGELDVVGITTRCGRNITAALDHPFLTDEGWLEAKDLREGMSLAIINNPHTSPSYESTPEEARLLGYFIGDGCCVYQNKNSASFSKRQDVAARLICHEPLELEDIKYVVSTMNFSMRRVDEGRYDLKGGERDWLRRV